MQISPPDARARHLAPELVARLLSGGVEAGELAREVLPHLLALCPGCQAARDELEALQREVGHWDYGIALAEGRQAPELWRRLEPLSHAERLAAVGGDSAFHTWGLCSLLLRLAGDAAGESPATAARLASLATLVAGRLGDAYHPAWVRDLRALSFARLADARRAMGELLSAGHAFDAARGLLAAGTGDPGLEAEVLTLEALLRRDQHALAEASQLLARAYALCASAFPAGAHHLPAGTDHLTAGAHHLTAGADHLPAGADHLRAGRGAADPGLVVRALAHRAWCLHHLGQPGPADDLLAEAERRADAEPSPALRAILLAVRVGRVWTAVARADLSQMEIRLSAADHLAAHLGDLPARLRLRRAEAAIARAHQQRESAEQSLRDAARGLLQANLGCDAALAFLDLAALYQEQGAAASLRRLAADLLPVFSAPDLERDAFEALLRFQRACAGDRLTAGFVHQVAARIESARAPSLAWWSASASVLVKETDIDDVSSHG